MQVTITAFSRHLPARARKSETVASRYHANAGAAPFLLVYHRLVRLGVISTRAAVDVSDWCFHPAELVSRTRPGGEFKPFVPVRCGLFWVSCRAALVTLAVIGLRRYFVAYKTVPPWMTDEL